MRSLVDDIDGPVHYLEYEGAAAGPTFVLLHALEGHHANWLGLAPLLARRGRVLVPDLAGFGLTPMGSRSASLGAHQRFLDRFLDATAAAPAILVGNSMGAAVALLQARASPSSVRGLVLIGPALARSFRHGVDPRVVPVFAGTLVPTQVANWFGRRISPLGPEWFVRQMLLLCTVNPERVPADIVAANVAVARERLARMPWAPGAFNQAARSTMRLLASPRLFWRAMREVTSPTLLLGGSGDRLVPPAVLHAAALQRPDWDVEVLDGVGHMPQLEDPEGTAVAIERWLGARLAPAV